jgi:hypothetical protein
VAGRARTAAATRALHVELELLRDVEQVRAGRDGRRDGCPGFGEKGYLQAREVRAMLTEVRVRGVRRERGGGVRTLPLASGA